MFSLSIGEVVNKDKEIKRCLIDAYRKTDEEFLQEATKQYVIMKMYNCKYTINYATHFAKSQILTKKNLRDLRASTVSFFSHITLFYQQPNSQRWLDSCVNFGHQ